MKKPNNAFDKNSNVSHAVSPISRCASVAALVLALIAAGCAHQPWDSLVEEQQSARLTGLYDQQRSLAGSCASGLDGTVMVQWKTAVDDVSLSGYFQIMKPSLIRFTVANPLGQPQLILATDNKSYRILNVPLQTAYLGSLRAYAARSDFPLPFLNGPWFAWLSGQLVNRGIRIAEIRNDEEARGYWYLLVSDDARGIPIEYLLLDPTSGHPLKRTIVDEEGDRLADISYRDWQPVGNCEMPMDISVTGLSFWAEAHMKYSDVQPASLTKSSFNITVPSGYLKQIRP